ncbi:hypothetical protein [Stutzerimonas stutzeri]|uniref:hypothetical protein n=1 Tax=Stutzerimonas stutzeri TaxID=316 RepID=UPI003D9FC069
MSSVVAFAEAYRKLGCPKSWSKNTLSFSCTNYSLNVGEAIESLRDSKAGQLVELVVDGDDLRPNDFSSSSSWATLSFTFTVDRSGSVQIFQDFEELMGLSKSFVRKPLPPHFYLIEDNLLSSEEPIDTKVKALQGICGLIVYLADLAHYHDEKGCDEYKLVFVADDGTKGERAVTLQPYLDMEFLSCEIGTDLLDSLQNGNLDNNPHLAKERSIFRSTLIEYLSGFSGGKERFKALLSTWAKFRGLYENNLATYLSGFSFHKAKQEVAAAQLTIADQMSKVVSDMSGKILSVPISLAVVIAIAKAEGVLEGTVLVMGVTLASALIAETLAAQKLQYERIKHSRTMIFESHQQKLTQYPQDLQRFLVEATSSLHENERKLRRSLRTLRFISWIPALAAISLHGYLYQAELHASWMNIQELYQATLNLMPCTLRAL